VTFTTDPLPTVGLIVVEPTTETLISLMRRVPSECTHPQESCGSSSC
jgi:hypothetical protein